MVFGASVLWCCALYTCVPCLVHLYFRVVFCVRYICATVLCSVFDISVLSCCVLCWRICTFVLCSVQLPCMDAGAREKLVQSFSIKRNLIPSKPHHNQLMCNELADIGSNLLIFFVGCLRIIVDQLDHVETLLRAYLDYFMTLVTWVTLDYLPLKI